MKRISFSASESDSHGSMKCEEQIFPISLLVRCGMPSLTKNLLHVGGGGAMLHGPSVSW